LNYDVPVSKLFPHLPEKQREKIRNLRRLFSTPGKSLPEELKQKWRRHFKSRPFDILKWGLLKIVTKNDGLQWFVLNDEQLDQLKHIECEYYAKRPVRIIVLKARQIGETTFIVGCIFVLCNAHNYTRGHFVSDIGEKAEHQIDIFNNYWENLPDWLRPKKSKKVKPLSWDDPEKDVRNVKVHFESAERRENISRSFTFQFNNFSELAFWPENCQAEIGSALINAVPDDWPSFIAEESTGKVANDLFYNRYMKAKDGNLPGYKSFFYAWFHHREYRKQLPESMSEEDFWLTCSDADLQLRDAYDLDPEQMAWYINKREQQMSSSQGYTLDLFRRENPSNEEEAFLGVGGNVYDPERLKQDLMRIKTYRMKESLDDLPTSCSMLDRTIVPGWVKCDIVTDWPRFKEPGLVENMLKGELIIYEMPREGHGYVEGIDIAEGKPTQKNILTSKDWSIIDVWRYTYEAEYEEPRITQVAQYKCQNIDPRELAKIAVALSVMYYDGYRHSKATICPERNNDGKAFIDAAKEYQAEFYYRRIVDKDGTSFIEEPGFLTTGGVEAEGAKSVVVTQAKERYMMNLLWLMSMSSVLELQTYIKDDRGKYKGLSPHHDDTVSAKFLAMECIRFVRGDIVPVSVLPKKAKPDGRGIDLDDLEDWLEAPIRQKPRRMLATSNKGGKVGHGGI
jgi:hypothetical protein